MLFIRQPWWPLVLVLLLLSAPSEARSGPAATTKLQRITVTATAYNSLTRQTDRSPMHGAWGDHLGKLPKGVRGIAVSRDLYLRGLTRFQRVRIRGQAGEFMVVDRTHGRWRNRIDIYMGKDLRAARKWGRRKVVLLWQRQPLRQRLSAPVRRGRRG